MKINNEPKKRDRRKYVKMWRKLHPDAYNRYMREYRRLPKNRLYQREYHKIYQKKSKFKKWRKEYNKTPNRKEHIKIYRRERRKTDIRFHLDCNMATLMSIYLRGKKAGQSWRKLVGYTIDDLMKHLEKQFDGKMTWDNYGKWHIDHIKPRSLFEYKTTEDPEFKKCWALKNLQPLWARENLSKSNRL